MNTDLAKIKEDIAEIKMLLDLSYYCSVVENRKKLLEEFDRLSYKYYKASLEQMINLEGDGDGI